MITKINSKFDWLLTCETAYHCLPAGGLEIGRDGQILQLLHGAGRGHDIAAVHAAVATVLLPLLVRLAEDLADIAEHMALVQKHVVRVLELQAPAAHRHLLKE